MKSNCDENALFAVRWWNRGDADLGTCAVSSLHGCGCAGERDRKFQRLRNGNRIRSDVDSEDNDGDRWKKNVSDSSCCR